MTHKDSCICTEINTPSPDSIIYSAANLGYQLTPNLVTHLSKMCQYQISVLLYEIMIMYPDELVFDLHHLSDILAIVIIIDEVAV